MHTICVEIKPNTIKTIHEHAHAHVSVYACQRIMNNVIIGMILVEAQPQNGKK